MPDPRLPPSAWVLAVLALAATFCASCQDEVFDNPADPWNPRTTAPPSILVPEGEHLGQAELRFLAEEGATVHYSLGGETPDALFPTYSPGSPLILRESAQVLAIAVKPSSRPSACVSAEVSVRPLLVSWEFSEGTEGWAWLGSGGELGQSQDGTLSGQVAGPAYVMRCAIPAGQDSWPEGALFAIIRFWNCSGATKASLAVPGGGAPETLFAIQPESAGFVAYRVELGDAGIAAGSAPELRFEPCKDAPEGSGQFFAIDYIRLYGAGT